MDGNPFNIWRIQAHTKTHGRLNRDLLFADDAVLITPTEQALQRITSCLADASKLLGDDVSLRITEVLQQPISREEHGPLHVTIGDIELKSIQLFTYLGCIISSDARINKEIDNRLSMTNSSIGRLDKRVWSTKSLKNKTRIQVYRAVVLTTHLYGSENGSPAAVTYVYIYVLHV